MGKTVIRYELNLILLLSLASWITTGVVWAVGKPAAGDGSQKCYTALNSVAISYCTEAIESGQLSGKALGFAFYRRANAYNEIGERDRAIADYNQAIRINPNHAGSFSNRGVAHARPGALPCSRAVVRQRSSRRARNSPRRRSIAWYVNSRAKR